MTKADKEGQRKTPILRFKGFTDDWEQRKLGEIGKLQSGIGFPSTEQGGTEGIPFYKVSDMNNPGNEHEMTNANNYVTNEQLTRRKWNPIKNVPAVIFAKVGAAIMLNRKRLVTIPFLIDNNTMAYSFSNCLEINFGKTLFETIYLPKYVQIGALPSYNISDIQSIKVFIPNKDEQIKIGKIINIFNNLITLYERKYQLYLLQFQKLQRVIFDNSDDFISLSYLIEIKTGNRNSQDNVKNGKYVFFDRSTEIKRLNEFDFDEEAIIIPGEGTKFAPKYINGKYALHQRSYSLYNFSQEIDSKYLYYFLMTQSNTLLRYSVGTTVPSLRVSTFDHIKVPMYSKELQIKYALTFDSLEKLMNQIKKKTNILRSLKRFLLQVLFL